MTITASECILLPQMPLVPSCLWILLHSADYTVACYLLLWVPPEALSLVLLSKWIRAMCPGVRYVISRCASFLVGEGVRCHNLSCPLKECLNMPWASTLKIFIDVEEMQIVREFISHTQEKNVLWWPSNLMPSWYSGECPFHHIMTESCRIDRTPRQDLKYCLSCLKGNCIWSCFLRGMKKNASAQLYSWAHVDLFEQKYQI